jgi:peptide/nickel transport system substrate-binding protein
MRSAGRVPLDPAISIAVAIVAALMTTACVRDLPSTSDRVTIGMRAAPNRLDPRKGGDEASQRIAQLIFDPLMTFGDDLRVKPVLAERLDNPDPLTYVAHLRHGVRFHDGHELTSKDVVYTFQAFLDPKFDSPFKGAYRALKAVTASDAYTVVFTLLEPFTAFPTQLVNTPPVVPYGSAGTLATHPVGTGPYRFVRFDTDEQIVLEAFPGYWQGAPRNAGVTVKVIPDDTMRGLELRKGSIDVVANDLPPDITFQLGRSGEFRVEESPGLDFSYIAFNMRDPVLADRRVRHAIGYAIDRDAIVRYLRRGMARTAFGLMPPQAWAFEPDAFQFTFDPERAKQLLDESGHPDPDGTGREPRLRLSLRVSTSEEARLQAAVVQADLARVGIALEVRSSELATLFDDVARGNFQMFSLQFVGGGLVDPDIIRRVFHSQQVPPAGFNRGHYSNPTVDALIDKATMALDEASRRRLYGDAQKIIAEDAPLIPLWNRTNVVVSQRNLSGLQLNATGDFSALRAIARVHP